ncbi:MAG: hypothetical protein ACJASX_004033 [Limisphaerales bacterium]|jgi:hypothetical protein
MMFHLHDSSCLTGVIRVDCSAAMVFEECTLALEIENLRILVKVFQLNGLGHLIAASVAAHSFPRVRRVEILNSGPGKK